MDVGEKERERESNDPIEREGLHWINERRRDRESENKNDRERERKRREKRERERKEGGRNEKRIYGNVSLCVYARGKMVRVGREAREGRGARGDERVA